MPSFTVTSPDGNQYVVNGPEGATQQDAIRYIQAQMARVPTDVADVELAQEIPEPPAQPKLSADEYFRQQMAEIPITRGVLDTVKSGISRGARQTGSLLGDVLPALGASALGFDDYAKRQMDEAKAVQEDIERTNPQEIKSFQDIDSLGSFGKFVLERGSEQLPNIAFSLLTGGVGGAAGKAIATRAAESALAKTAEKRLAAEALKQVGPMQTAEIAAQSLAASGAGQRMLGSAALSGGTKGAMAGAFLGSYALNAPEIFQNVYEQTNGDLAPVTSLLFGGVAGALDSILPFKLTKPENAAVTLKLLQKSGMEPRLLNSVGKEFLKSAGIEGLTEGAQEALSISAERIVGENYEALTSEEFNRVLESVVVGSVVGGPLGAVGGAQQHFQERGIVEDMQEAKALQDTQDRLAALEGTEEAPGLVAQQEQKIAGMQAAPDFDPANKVQQFAIEKEKQSLAELQDELKRGRMTPDELELYEEELQQKAREKSVVSSDQLNTVNTVNDVFKYLDIKPKEAAAIIEGLKTKGEEVALDFKSPVAGTTAENLLTVLHHYVPKTEEQAAKMEEFRTSHPLVEAGKIAVDKAAQERAAFEGIKKGKGAQEYVAKLIAGGDTTDPEFYNALMEVSGRGNKAITDEIDKQIEANENLKALRKAAAPAEPVATTEATAPETPEAPLTEDQQFTQFLEAKASKKARENYINKEIANFNAVPDEAVGRLLDLRERINTLNPANKDALLELITARLNVAKFKTAAEARVRIAAEKDANEKQGYLEDFAAEQEIQDRSNFNDAIEEAQAQAEDAIKATAEHRALLKKANLPKAAMDLAQEAWKNHAESVAWEKVKPEAQLSLAEAFANKTKTNINKPTVKQIKDAVATAIELHNASDPTVLDYIRGDKNLLNAFPNGKIPNTRSEHQKAVLEAIRAILKAQKEEKTAAFEKKLAEFHDKANEEGRRNRLSVLEQQLSPGTRVLFSRFFKREPKSSEPNALESAMDRLNALLEQNKEAPSQAKTEAKSKKPTDTASAVDRLAALLQKADEEETYTRAGKPHVHDIDIMSDEQYTAFQKLARRSNNHYKAIEHFLGKEKALKSLAADMSAAENAKLSTKTIVEGKAGTANEHFGLEGGKGRGKGDKSEKGEEKANEEYTSLSSDDIYTQEHTPLTGGKYGKEYFDSLSPEDRATVLSKLKDYRDMALTYENIIRGKLERLSKRERETAQKEAERQGIIETFDIDQFDKDLQANKVLSKDTDYGAQLKGDLRTKALWYAQNHIGVLMRNYERTFIPKSGMRPENRLEIFRQLQKDYNGFLKFLENHPEAKYQGKRTTLAMAEMFERRGNPHIEVKKGENTVKQAIPTTVKALRDGLIHVMRRPDVFDNKVKIFRNPKEAGIEGVPEDVRGAVVRNEKDPNDYKVYLFADNIPEGKGLSIFLHELAGHIGMRKLLGEGNYKYLVDNIKRWAADDKAKSIENAIAKRVSDKVEILRKEDNLTPEEANEELLAYFIEEAVNHGIRPSELADTHSPLGLFFRKVLAGINNILNKVGLGVKDLNAQDIVDLAYGAAHVELEAQSANKLARTSAYRSEIDEEEAALESRRSQAPSTVPDSEKLVEQDRQQRRQKQEAQRKRPAASDWELAENGDVVRKFSPEMIERFKKYGITPEEARQPFGYMDEDSGKFVELSAEMRQRLEEEAPGTERIVNLILDSRRKELTEEELEYSLRNTSAQTKPTKKATVSDYKKEQEPLYSAKTVKEYYARLEDYLPNIKPAQRKLFMQQYLMSGVEPNERTATRAEMREWEGMSAEEKAQWRRMEKWRRDDRERAAARSNISFSRPTPPAVSPQIPSNAPITNAMTFGRLKDFRDGARVWGPDAIEGLKNAVSNLPAASTSKLFSVLSNRQFADMVEKESKTMAKAIRGADSAYGEQLAKEAKDNQKIAANLKNWTTTFKKFTRAQRHDFEEVFHESTRLQVKVKDPAFATHDLTRRYNRFSPEAKKMYDDIFASYADFGDRYIDSIDKLTNGELSTTMKATYDAMKRALDPYAPLQRYGDFWISYVDKNNETMPTAFATERQRRLFKEELIKQGIKEKDIKTYQRLSDINTKTVPPTAAFMRVLESMRKHGAKQELIDETYRTYLNTLPGTAIQQQFQRRQGYKNYEGDALRTYADVANKMVRQLAHMEFAKKLDEHLDIARDVAVQHPSDFSAMAYDSFLSRAAYMRAPIVDDFSSKAGKLSYNYYILNSVGTALMNILGLPTITHGMLAGEYGHGKSAAAISKAMSMVLKGGYDDNSVVNSFFTGRNLSDISFYGNKARKNKAFEAAYADLYDAAVNRTAIRRSTAQELTARKNMRLEDYTGTRVRIEGSLGWMFQNSERFIREVSLLSAYHLALGSGLSKKEAIQKALNFTDEVSGAATTAQGAPIFQGSFGRFVGIFKKYPMAMAYLQAKLFRNAFAGVDRKTRDLARKQLLSIYGMAYLFAGVKGMPLVGIGTALAGMFNSMFGDEDEPYDPDFALQSAVGDVSYYGPVGSALNIDLGRIGLTNMFYRSDPERFDKLGAVPYALETLGGAPVSIALGMERGVEHAAQGHWMRAIESASPAFIRNALKGWELMSSGLVNSRGQLIMGTSKYDAVLQAFGITPLDVRKTYTTNELEYRANKYLNLRYQSFFDRYNMAVELGDVDEIARIEEEKEAWNEKYPRKQITAEKLSQSVKMHQKKVNEAVYGVNLDPTLQEQIRDIYEPHR